MNIVNPVQLMSLQQTQAISDDGIKPHTLGSISFAQIYSGAGRTITEQQVQMSVEPSLKLEEFGITSLPVNTAEIDQIAKTLDIPASSSRAIAEVSAEKSKSAMNLYASSSTTVSSDSNFIFSNMGLEKLRSEEDKDVALMKVSQQFEAIFVQQMLKGMRTATQAMADTDNPMSQSKDNMFQDMLDNKLATSLTSEGQFGLAESIYRQLSRG